MQITLVKRWAWGCLLAVIATTAVAIEPFIVDDIQVQGLNRISPGTVFNYLTITVGDTVDDQKSRNALRALFKTGFFRDVHAYNRLRKWRLSAIKRTLRSQKAFPAALP